MMPWKQIRNVHAVSGGGDIAKDKNGTVSSEEENDLCFKNVGLLEIWWSLHQASFPCSCCSDLADFLVQTGWHSDLDHLPPF